MLGDEQPTDRSGDGEDSAGGPESKRGPGRPRKLTEDVKPDPMAMLAEILSKMGSDNREQMMEFAKELRKPTEREQRKIDEEDKRLERAQSERLALAKAEVQRRENNRLGCPHARINQATGVSRHMWRAQVHAPTGVQPYAVPTCQMCQTQTGKIPASPDMLTQGVNLDQYAGLTYDALTKWAEQYKA